MLEILNVIEEIVGVQRATTELWMRLGGLLSTHEARVTLTYHLVRLLPLLSCLAASHVHPYLNGCTLLADHFLLFRQVNWSICAGNSLTIQVSHHDICQHGQIQDPGSII